MLGLEHRARDPPGRRLWRDDYVGVVCRIRICVGMGVRSRRRRVRAGLTGSQGEHGAGLLGGMVSSRARGGGVLGERGAGRGRICWARALSLWLAVEGRGGGGGGGSRR